MSVPAEETATAVDKLSPDGRSNFALAGLAFVLTIVSVLVFALLERLFGPEVHAITVIPVALIAWSWGPKWGLIAVAFNLAFNLYPGMDTQTLTPLELAIGSSLMVVMVLVLHYVRERVRKSAQTEAEFQSRERYHTQLNSMTRAMLLSKDFDTTIHALAGDMAKLIDADDCSIAYWDDGKKILYPAASTSSELQDRDQKSFISFLNSTSLLEGSHVTAFDDLHASAPGNQEDGSLFPARSLLFVPLIARGQRLGATVLTFKTLHHFTEEEIERVEYAGNHISLALWNFQQGQKIQQRLKESRTLTEIGRALSEIEHGGSDKVLQLIVDSARELIPKAEQAVIHIVDAQEDILFPGAISGSIRGKTGNSNVRMQMGTGVAGQVIRDGVTINIADVQTDPRFLRGDDAPVFRSLMVSPIQSGRQQIGTISVQSILADAFSKEEEELIKALGIDAAIAIDNTRSFEATQQRLKEVNALYGTIQVLAASLNPQELANDVVALLQKNFGYYFVQLFLVDEEAGDLVLKAGSGEMGRQLLEEQFRIPRGVGISGHVFETGVSFFTNNVNDVVFFQRSPFLPDTQFELAVPIKIEKQVVGVLDIQDKPPRRLADSDLQLVTAVADQFAVALHKANLYTDLEHAMQQEQSIRSQLIQSERLALVGRLLASVSHELNNPLQAIQNALFLLKEESGISVQGHQDLSIVLSETERMAALIERLRSAYRPIRGSDFHPVQLNNLIEDVYALINTHMRHKEISFDFFPETNLSPVSGISDQLRQVVLNLFLNAAEVMRPGGCITVETRNLVDQGEVLFSVKDSGPGIDEQILPKIFDPFITSKHSGTGLGLTITHDILHQHRGRIQAENHPDGGAIFHVWLPICEDVTA
jgi:signal transduction histidine kinase